MKAPTAKQADAREIGAPRDQKRGWFGFNWTTLKRLKSSPGSVAITSFVVVVPLFTAAAVIARKYNFAIGAPTNMFVLYGGSLCYWIASVLVELRCPRIIKEYVSKYAFEEACINSEMRNREFAKEPKERMAAALSAMVGADSRTPRTDQVGSATAAAESVQIRSPVDQATFDKKRIEAMMRHAVMLSQPGALRWLWDSKDVASGKARCVATALYLLSFLAIGYVTLIDAPIRVWAGWAGH